MMLSKVMGANNMDNGGDGHNKAVESHPFDAGAEDDAVSARPVGPTH